MRILQEDSRAAILWISRVIPFFFPLPPPYPRFSFRTRSSLTKGGEIVGWRRVCTILSGLDDPAGSFSYSFSSWLLMSYNVLFFLFFFFLFYLFLYFLRNIIIQFVFCLLFIIFWFPLVRPRRNILSSETGGNLWEQVRYKRSTSRWICNIVTE